MRISDWSSDVCSSDLTGVPWNESSYTNPTFDRLLDEAESMPDPNVRREKMAEIEQLMQDDGPIVQTYWTKLFTFYDKHVVGFGMPLTYSVLCDRKCVLSGKRLSVQLVIGCGCLLKKNKKQKTL